MWEIALVDFTVVFSLIKATITVLSVSSWAQRLEIFVKQFYGVAWFYGLWCHNDTWCYIGESFERTQPERLTHQLYKYTSVNCTSAFFNTNLHIALFNWGNNLRFPRTNLLTKTKIIFWPFRSYWHIVTVIYVRTGCKAQSHQIVKYILSSCQMREIIFFQTACHPSY